MFHKNNLHITYGLIRRTISLFSFAILLLFVGAIGIHAETTVEESTASTLKIVISTGFGGIERISSASAAGEMILAHFTSAEADEDPENIGAPQMFYSGADFATAGDGTFSIASFRILESEEIGGTAACVPVIDRDGEGIYSPDAAKYSAFKNPETAIVYFKGISAGIPVGSVRISALNYDNEAKAIRIIKKIEVVINFNTPLKLSNKVKNNAVIPLVNQDYSVRMVSAVPDKIIRKNSADRLQSAAKWAKIPITETGAYSLTADQLKSLGADVSAEGAKNIRIFGYGGNVIDGTPSKNKYADMPEQQIYREYNSDGTLAQIVFFAQSTKGVYRSAKGINKFINPYTAKSYYLLSFGGENSALETSPSGYDGEILNRPSTYRSYIYEEEDNENPFPAASGQQWFGKPSFPVSYTHKFYNLDRDSAITYTFALAHKLTYSGSTTYGYFYIYENGTKISSQQISAYAASYDASRKVFSFSSSASNIASDDRSIVKIEYKTNGSSYGVPYLDYYIIGYERSTAAVDNEMEMIAPRTLSGGTEYTVTGFSGAIYAWDITNPTAPAIEKNYSTTGSIFVLRTNPTDSAGNHFYLSSKLRKAVPETITLAGLRNDPEIPDIIVITNKDLKQSADNYSAYRNSQGKFTAKVYTTEDIFNEFGCGMSDPSALRNFVTYKYHQSDNALIGKYPRFVLLWGDGHDDYRNIATNVVNFVPTFESEDADFELFNETSSYCTDDYFALVDGDDYLLDLSVGRLPVRTNADGNIMLDKIKKYENSSDDGVWRSRFTFIADDCNLSNGNTETLNHVPQSEAVSEISPLDYFDKKKIYLVNYPVVITSEGRRKPKVTEDLLSTANVSGTIFLNFIGHGNPRVWTHEEILERDITIPKFTNINKLFFCYAATCDYGRFDNAEVSSGAEDFVRLASGAAIGILTATRTVLISNNGAFSKVYFDQLFQRNSDGTLKTMGEIVSATKNASNNSFYKGKSLVTNDAKYCLIADPAVTLLEPKEDIKITKIDTTEMKDSAVVNLEGLTEVSVQAKVCIPGTDSLDADFNGVAVMTLYDAAETVYVPEYSYTNVIRRQGETLARTSAVVTGGVVSGSFFISKDISFSSDNAKLVIYAYSNDELKSALGGTEAIKVQSINQNAVREDNGPTVKLYLDSRNFTLGQTVSSEPLLIVDLSDDTGINTSGNGIGRKIEMWLDNDEAEDLTSLYVNSFTDPRSGSIEKRLYSLAEGDHTLKVRAWDLFDNYTVSTTKFHIGASSVVDISKTYLYPNPLTTTAGNFEIFHTASSQYSVEIEIYNISGNKIKTIKTSSSDLNKLIVPFDGYDDYGRSIPQGMYLYYVKIHNSIGTGESHGKFEKLE